jgi:hypothetical protein
MGVAETLDLGACLRRGAATPAGRRSSIRDDGRSVQFFFGALQRNQKIPDDPHRREHHYDCAEPPQSNHARPPLPLAPSWAMEPSVGIGLWSDSASGGE